jgi:hypothetical protein
MLTLNTKASKNNARLRRRPANKAKQRECTRRRRVINREAYPWLISANIMQRGVRMPKYPGIAARGHFSVCD